MNMTPFMGDRIIVPWIMVMQIITGALIYDNQELIISAAQSGRDCITIAIGFDALDLQTLQENAPIVAIMVKETLTQSGVTFQSSNSSIPR